MSGSLGPQPVVTGSPCPPDPTGSTTNAPDRAPAGALFQVSYGDEDHFFLEGDRRRFGRDDDACEIPIWEEIRRTEVSKVAGVLWCMDAELWVRNLSQAHELEIDAPQSPPHLLPVCEPGELGAARSVPVPFATISAPTTGSWTLLVRRLLSPVAPHTMNDADPSRMTTRIGPPPAPLQPVALALCAPILEHDRPPATYDQVAAALGLTRRQARRRVEELSAHYRSEYPSLLSGDPRSGEPVYAELARLLVRRGVVTTADLEAGSRPA